MDHYLMIWRIDQEDINGTKKVTKVIAKSDLSTCTIHNNYVDCVLWVDKNIFISKATTENMIIMWMIGAYEDQELDLDDRNTSILRRFHLPNTDVWFFKMSCDVTRRFIAAGNTSGETFVYDLAKSQKRRDSNRQQYVKTNKTFARHSAISNDSKILLVSHEDGAIEKFNLNQ